MLPLWLLPLGFFALSRGRTVKYKKPVNSNTGLIFSCSKIEILNKQTAYKSIDLLIESFRRNKKISNLEQKTIEIFDFILKSLDKCCYKKMKNGTLSQKEKVIVSLLFIIIFNRLFNFVNQNRLLYEFETKDHTILIYLLDLTEDDEDIIDIANDQFNINYSYP